MLRKSLSVVLCFALVLSILAAVPFGVSAAQQDSSPVGETYKGFYYDVFISDEKDSSKNYAIIYGYNGEDIDITIPDTINGYYWGTGKYYLCKVTGIGDVDHSRFIGKNEENFRSISIPDTVTSIYPFAFSKLPKLEKVTIPGSVTYIGRGAFTNCDSLLTANIPSSVTTLGEGAFMGCDALKSFSSGNGLTTWEPGLIHGCTALQSVTIGKNISVIESTGIGMSMYAGVFYRCPNLVSVKVDKGNKTFDSRDNCNAVIHTETNELVAGCRSTVIPQSVVSIGSNAFSATENLTSITLPDKVKEIGDAAFYGCKDLQDVKFSRSLAKIDSEAFYRCEGLTNVDLPDSLESIGASSFKDCPAMKAVTIPPSVTEIKRDAFGYYTVKNENGYNEKVKVDGFTIRGYKNTAAETYAKENEFKFVAMDDLPAPQLIKVQNTADGVELTWGKVNNAEKYRVYRKVDSGSWAKVADTTAVTLLDKKVSSGSKYTYTVRCISKDGKRNASDYDKVGKSIVYLAVPKVNKLENVENGMKLTWGKVTGAASYQVYVKNGSSWKDLGTVKTNTYTYTKVKSGTKYSFTVRATDKSGKYVSAYNAKGRTLLHLARPKVTKLENVIGGTKITWNKVAGAASYKVFVKNGKTWHNVKGLKANTFTYKSVKSGKTYIYAVRAVDKTGKVLSAISAKGWSCKYIAAPALPTLKNTKSGVKITFKKVAGAEKYRIFRKTGKGKWTKLADTAKLTLVDKTAKNGKKYAYTVCCVSKNGKAYTSAYNAKGKSVTCKR